MESFRLDSSLRGSSMHVRSCLCTRACGSGSIPEGVARKRSSNVWAPLMATKRKHDGDAAHLMGLHRGPYISQAALTYVLRDIRDNGLPTAKSEASQRRAHEKICSQDTP